MVYYVLTGVSGCFKTTALCELARLGYPVIPGDYYKDCKAYPDFANKHKDEITNLEYMVYANNKMRPFCINDRACFETIIYSLIFEYMREHRNIDVM